MGFMELAKARFSVRKFADKPVEQEKLDLLLEAGNIAPTAKNQQPQRIYVIRSKEALEKLAEYTPCIYGAGTVLLFAYNTTEQFFNPDEPGVCSGIRSASSLCAAHSGKDCSSSTPMKSSRFHRACSPSARQVA